MIEINGSRIDHITVDCNQCKKDFLYYDNITVGANMQSFISPCPYCGVVLEFVFSNLMFSNNFVYVYNIYDTFSP